jgi:phospholipase D3/4
MKYILSSEDGKSLNDIARIHRSPQRVNDYWYTKYQESRDEDSRFDERKPYFKPSCIPISLILVLIIMVVLLPLLDGPHAINRNKLHKKKQFCSGCNLFLVESIPEGLVYPNNSVKYSSTFDTWDQLIHLANFSIEIASFYWTLRGIDVINHTSAWEGEHIFNALLNAGTVRNISIKIAQSQPSSISENQDTILLARKKAADVRLLDLNRLLGAGVLHTKLWIVDHKHFYVGSANMDWRALTQVKELGVVGYNCSCLADDLAKVFKIYWYLGEENAKIPDKWPNTFNTEINEKQPMEILLNGINATAYFSGSPSFLNPSGRTNDIDAILLTINEAEKFIYISVMDYVPMTLYTKAKEFWPTIDNALRKAAIERNVTIRLLISQWDHSPTEIDNFLKSLTDLNGVYSSVKIDERRFVVPTTEDQTKIPFARVNHNKYMVTDKTAYIGTSNWSGDYFINTAGIGFVFSDSQNQSVFGTLRTQLMDIFERDWNSPYAKF